MSELDTEESRGESVVKPFPTSIPEYWCLGLPRVASRPMTDEERSLLYREARRYSIAAASIVLFFPICGISVLLLPYGDKLAIAMITIMMSAVVLFGVVASTENPLGKAIGLWAAYRAGTIDRYYGIEAQMPTLPPYQYERELRWLDLKQPQALEILPSVRRLWTVNESYIPTWKEVVLFHVPQPEPPSSDTSENESLSLDYDSGFFLALVAILITIIAVNAFGLSLLFAIGLVVGIWIVEALIVRVILNRIQAKMESGE